MSWREIRPVALGVPFRGDEALLARHHDETANETFYRPLGGGIDFGEQSAAAVRREFREELGADVAVERRLGVLENVFEYEGTEGHEVVFVYEVDFEDDARYDRDEFTAVEGTGEAFHTTWMRLTDFGEDGDVLYPTGLSDVLAER